MFKLSSEASLDGAITVENKFIVEYMPYADGDYVKVYLYGLSLAARKSDADDTVDRLARRLDLDVATVDAAIDYWSDQGLMSRLGDDVCYFSPRTARPKIKKFDVDKYREFNRQAQLYICSRQITPNEFGEYYALMEKLNVEWQAMVLVVKYCVDMKGDNVSCPYILAVARNLAQEGYHTADDIGERLEEYGVYYNDLVQVLAAMGGKRPDHESVQLYKKWKKSFRFEPPVILFVAENIKRGGAAALDAKLTQYYELGFSTVEQIDEYETERKRMYKLAKSVNKALGLYYDNVDPEIANYIKPWLDMNFEQEAIVAAAEYCMKKDMKRLSDLDAVVRDLFANGATSKADVSARFENERRHDGNIEQLKTLFNLQGGIKDVWRAYYSAWADAMAMPNDVIYYAATLAKDKSNPFAYADRVLREWHKSGATNLAAAKTAQSAVFANATPITATADAKSPSGIVYEKYSEEYLNSLFAKATED